MEGGYLPWKNKRINVIDHLEAIRKPLPPPPPGSTWYKAENGDWQLLSCKDDGTYLPTTQSSEPLVGSVVAHTVMPDDTLQGLCLRYGASPVAVRRMNHFSGNSIQFKTTLLIPVGRAPPKLEQSPEYAREIILQQFRNRTGESIAEARFYLEDANYDLDAAIAEWCSDEQWEKGKRGPVATETATSTATNSRSTSAPSLTQLNDSSAAPMMMVDNRPMRIVAPACVVEVNIYEYAYP